MRSLALFRGKRWAAEHRESMEAMIREQAEAVKAAYGAEPDLDLFDELFSPPIPHESIADNVEEFGVHRARVDGVIVRYVESVQSVTVVVEGDLPNDACDAIVTDLRAKLAALEHIEYTVRDVRA